jgi:hypothetical protein
LTCLPTVLYRRSWPAQQPAIPAAELWRLPVVGPSRPFGLSFSL